METEFLITCRELYFKKIHPFDFEKTTSDDYQKALTLGKSIIEEKGLHSFLYFQMEGQYRVNLWTALIGLEYVNPNDSLKVPEKLIDELLNSVKAGEIAELPETTTRNRDNWIKEQEDRFGKSE
ncbi:hypothetical protein [Rufibacter immobilis]|uniref:hypothetical protein n=1 Tax=Rufibacter immobilis TaxID=1348778 RepID=UPI0011CD8AA0|nr:hypothetical protein [Rufibacter immobilis]